MVKHCSSYGCNSRYSPEAKNEGITFYNFPKNEDLRTEWEKVVRRQDFKSTKNSVLCSKHFKPEDFIVGEQRKKLKPGIIPSVFEGMPSYYQPKVGSKRKAPTERQPVELKYPKFFE